MDPNNNVVNSSACRLNFNLCAIFYCSLPKLSKIMQDKVLQLLPHPQRSGKTKRILAKLCNRANNKCNLNLGAKLIVTDQI